MGNKIIASLVNNVMPNKPLIVILGCTGTGKSKLAIELAMKFNGEIISADSMQVYKGLDIITNKVTVEEQLQAVHHLISCVDPLSQYTVIDFQKHALPLITKIQNSKKLPIIVGGTNYYIESLLWDVLIKPKGVSSDNSLCESNSESKNEKLIKIQHSENQRLNASENKNCEDFVTTHDTNHISSESSNQLNSVFSHEISQDSLVEYSNEILHQVLAEVDPVMANALHPNDRRKVIRSLQVYQQHGCCHSEILKKQRSQKGGCSVGGPLRFKNSIMLWLQCDKDVLKNRLDARVDKMVENGLIGELLNFHNLYNETRLQQNIKPNYEEGIFQSIGFKEFHNYLILSEEERNSAEGLQMCEKAIEQVKLATRQYSRKQTKWIVNRFLKKPNREVPPVYGLDATDLSCWEEQVFDIAAEIVKSIIEGKSPPVSPLAIEESCEDVRETYYCEVCEKYFVGQNTWLIHISSNKHYRRKKSAQKRNVIHVQNSI